MSILFLDNSASLTGVSWLCASTVTLRMPCGDTTRWPTPLPHEDLLGGNFPPRTSMQSQPVVDGAEVLTTRAQQTYGPVNLRL
jgi:hypothetical protein